MLSSSLERLVGFFFWGPMNGMGWFCCIVPVVLVVLMVVFIRRGGSRPEGPGEAGGRSEGGAVLHCPRCGTLLRPGARFCHRCGKAVG